MNELQKLGYDLRIYSIPQKITFFLDPAILGVVNFRVSAYFYNIRFTRFFYILYWPIWRLIANYTGIEIHGGTKIGKGLKICHFGGIFINDNCIIGENCTIFNDVTIGTNSFTSNENCPNIGNNVFIGVGSKILGKINIGDNVIVGAMSFVNKDVPSNVVVGGVPFKILKNN